MYPMPYVVRVKMLSVSKQGFTRPNLCILYRNTILEYIYMYHPYILFITSLILLYRINNSLGSRVDSQFARILDNILLCRDTMRTVTRSH